MRKKTKQIRIRNHSHHKPSTKLTNSNPQVKVTKSNTIIIFTLLFVIFGILSFYLIANRSFDLGAEISSFEDVVFSYSTHQNEWISPLCGCFTEQSQEEWRGLTFTARNIEVNNTNKNTNLTGYFITSPFPGKINWFPRLGFNVTIFSIALPNKYAFDPSMLLTKNFPKDTIVKTKTLLQLEGLYYMTDSNINISMLGEYPIASWIPMRNSAFTISKQKSMFPNSNATILLKEEHEEYFGKTWQDVQGTTHLTEYIDYPMGDFLGPNIALWSDLGLVLKKKENTLDPDNLIYVEKDFYNIIKNKDHITALLINPTFSTRITAIPINQIEPSKMAVKPASLDDVKNGKQLSVMASDAGTMTVSILDSIEQDEFENIYEKIRSNDSIIAKNFKMVDMDIAYMDFRFLPLPRHRGFSIFGDVNFLKFSSAVGKIMIGSSSLEVNAPSNIEFRNIKKLHTREKVIPIPIQIDTLSNKTNISFHGESEVFVNSTLATAMIHEYKYLIPYFALLISLFSAIIALVNFMRQQNKA